MWQKIIGHKKQKDLLKRAIQSKNVPHAYLFSGPEGIGKKLVARAVVHELIGESNRDLIEIGPDPDQITIDQIRHLKDQLKFAPLKGERRVLIIDQAETLNASAANAALKILEEPPHGNHFFLITSAPEQLLPTIVSRCQKVYFSPLTNGEVEEILISNHAYSKGQAKAAALISEGSVARALAIDPSIIDPIIEKLKEILKTGYAPAILETSMTWAAQKGSIQNILYILHRTFHMALLLDAGKKDTPGDSPIENLAMMIRSQNGRTQLLEKCNLINTAHSFINRTYNKQLMFEQLLFTLAA